MPGAVVVTLTEVHDRRRRRREQVELELHRSPAQSAFSRSPKSCAYVLSENKSESKYWIGPSKAMFELLVCLGTNVQGSTSLEGCTDIFARRTIDPNDCDLI